MDAITDAVAAVERLRAICLALPEVVERPSHEEPAWFIRGTRMLAFLDDHHHGADHLAFWCPAPPGAQEDLVDTEPDRFFRPPYVAAKGWIGVRLDRDPDWAEIAEICAEAYRLVAPKTLLARLDEDVSRRAGCPPAARGSSAAGRRRRPPPCAAPA